MMKQRTSISTPFSTKDQEGEEVFPCQRSAVAERQTFKVETDKNPKWRMSCVSKQTCNPVYSHFRLAKR